MMNATAAWNQVSAFASEVMKSRMDVEWRRQRVKQHSQSVTHVTSRAAVAAVAEVPSTENRCL